MRYTLQKKGGEPVYLQLYRALRQDIVGGVYPYGTRLPSKRLLATELDVSIVTVEHALAILAEEGYIVAVERSGFFVAFAGEDRFATAPVPVRANTPRHTHHKADTFPFSVLSRAMRRVLAEYGEEILVKSPNRGCDILRRAICNYLARSRGMQLLPEQIVIGSGAEYLYSLLAQMLAGEHIFGVEDPCYEKIRAIYRANGVRFEPLTMGKDGILTSALQGTHASVLHVTPYNSYPSGVCASASKRREYLAHVAAHEGFLIEDDFDSEFTVLTKVEDTLFSLDVDARVIYLNTFTRTIAPGMRMGYMVLPRALLPLFDTRVGAYSCTVPTFEQYLLATLLDSGDFERHINRTRRRRRAAAKNKQSNNPESKKT